MLKELYAIIIKRDITHCKQEDKAANSAIDHQFVMLIFKGASGSFVIVNYVPVTRVFIFDNLRVGMGASNPGDSNIFKAS